MLNREEVRKVARLARLSLTPEEEKMFTTQLGAILQYVEQLNELNTENVPPTTRAIETSNVTRSDETTAFPESDREMVFQAAPDAEDEFFKVPRILGE